MGNATMTKAAPAVVGSGREDLRWFFGAIASLRVHTETCTVVHITSPEGEMPPLHRHLEEDETFQVLEGELEFRFEGVDEPVRATVGDTAFAPRGLAHNYRVVSQGASWLVITDSAKFGHFFSEVSRPAEHDGLPPAMDGPPPPEVMERIDAAAARHGLELLGPPGTNP